MTGLMSVNGDASTGPMRLGTAIVDMGTGLYSAIGILMALHERERSGHGQYLDMTLYDCGMALLHPQAANFFLNGNRPAGTGNPHPNLVPYDKFPTKTCDIFIASGNNGQFRKMAEIIGRPELADDPRFADNGKRNVNRVALTEVLAAAFAEHDGNELSLKLIRGGVPAGPVLPVDEVDRRAAHRASRDGDGTGLVSRPRHADQAAPHAGRHAPAAAEVRAGRRRGAGAARLLGGRDRGAAARRRAADRTPQITAEPAGTGSGNMPETALPAREMLKLPGQTTIAWAVFDATWYLATYPDVRAELSGIDDAAVLRFYLEHGQSRGHSPNIWFDEAWHLTAHPGAAAAVRDGHAESGFDAYCRDGFRFRAPHWLFQETPYRQRYPDLRDEVLATDGNVNGYDHFLKHGSREGRIGHILFDPSGVSCTA